MENTLVTLIYCSAVAVVVLGAVFVYLNRWHPPTFYRLRQIEDAIHGRTIFSDTQMLNLAERVDEDVICLADAITHITKANPSWVNRSN